MPPSKNGNTNGTLVPAVDRAANLLRAVAVSKRALGVSELSRQLGLNKSTTHDILSTLCRHHFLERDQASKTYRLGFALAELGQLVDERTDLRGLAHPLLVSLAHDVDETVLLGTFSDGYVSIVDKEEAPHDVKITSPVGQRMQYHAAAFGKVFLAAMNDQDAAALLAARPLRSFTSRSITKPATYRAALRQVRADGYAVDDEEYLPGVRAVAAPINDSRGHVVAALCVVGFSTRLKDQNLLQIAHRTCATAKAISRHLGALAFPEWKGLAS